MTKIDKTISVKCPGGCTCGRHIGHPQTEYAKQQISKAQAGRRRTSEQRAAVAESMRRYWASFDGVAPNRGVKFSTEARANMALARQGNRNAATHGWSGTPTFNSWRDMRARCLYPSNPSYALYGGRGITFCERWRSFAEFLADMGPRPNGTTLDRIDADGHYEPHNCRWATPKEQAANRRRKKVVIR